MPQPLLEVGILALKPEFNHTGSVTVVAPTDRPKSFRNHCVIQRFCGMFM